MPKMTAYDLLLEISSHVPAQGQDHARHRQARRSTTRRSTCSGTTKTPEEIDLLVTELKKIECFKDNVTRGPTDTLPNGIKRFKLTITAQCM